MRWTWLIWALWALSGCNDGGEATAGDAAVSLDAALDASPDAVSPDGATLDAALAACEHPEGAAAPDSLRRLGCFADFAALASAPVDTTLPGARSLKTVLDRVDDNALYFQNVNLFPIHWDFASTHLSGQGLPIVPLLPEFNATEYSSSARRFVLGTVTYYEGPDLYVYEIAPYDTADAAMVTEAFSAIAAASFFGDSLRFHPTSVAVERLIDTLPASVPVVTTDELYAGVDYQPLNLAESLGQLRFVTAAELEAGALLSYREIVVLDQVPNDISVVLGIITEAFQTQLSHVNVLSKNRGTPNMALKGAYQDPALRALEGKWVRLTVGANDYSVTEVSVEEANAWWAAHRPAAVQVPGVDLTITDLRDLEDALDLESLSLYDAIKAATRAFGGKAAHYGALRHIEGVPVAPGFGIPVAHYFRFMEENGFTAQIEAWLADDAFVNDAAVRDARLAELRDAIEAAPLDETLLFAIKDKIRAEYPVTRMRFRSSTNAEDLDGFTGAGLYTSKTGDPDDPEKTVEDAIRKVYASVWSLRAFEERSFRGIEHLAVGMALLVHRSFPEEEANGVALTANPFDQSGLEPAFYINAQVGELSVVQPDPGVTTDSLLYYYSYADQPVTYLSRSNQVADGATVLSAAQVRELGDALFAIHRFFTPAYTPGPEDDYTWWAMDVEFKFDGADGETPALAIKQARPYR